MKTTFSALVIALGLALTSFSSIGSSQTDTAYKDPSPTGIKKEFSDVLSSFFGHELKLDSTLQESCFKFVEKEVDGKEIVKGENYAYFHQIWTLTDPLESYKSDDLTNSFDKMIRQGVYKDYFSRMEGESYWVEVIKKGDKYYLVVAVN
jgi:hypothetical protein